MNESHDFRKKFFIVGGIVAGLLMACLLLYLFFLREKPALPAGVPAAVTTTAERGRPPLSVPPRPDTETTRRTPAPQTPEDVYLRQLARLFVERAESYSNQNSNTHLADVATLATPRMFQYLASQAPVASERYASQTTVVVTTELTGRTAGRATVAVGAQQVERGDGPETVAYKTGRVELVETDGTWQVDGLFWE